MRESFSSICLKLVIEGHCLTFNIVGQKNQNFLGVFECKISCIDFSFKFADLLFNIEFRYFFTSILQFMFLFVFVGFIGPE